MTYPNPHAMRVIIDRVPQFSREAPKIRYRGGWVYNDMTFCHGLVIYSWSVPFESTMAGSEKSSQLRKQLLA